MTRKRGRGPKKSGGGGLLVGMRGGFKKAVKGTTGVGEAEEEKKPGSRVANIFWNVVTGILVVVALAIFLRRCGVLKF